MRIAIIGAGGQVGQEFAKRRPPGGLILWGRKDVDVCVYEQVEAMLARTDDIDVVINLAAFHNVNACEQDQAKAFGVNGTGAFNVAKATAKRGIRLVFFSSDYVFGQDGSRSTPYVESDAVGPVNVYEASKVAGEQLVRALNPNHMIVRTSSLFGVATSQKGWTFPEMIRGAIMKIRIRNMVTAASEGV